MKKGLTNGGDGCIMRLVKGNGVFERGLEGAVFFFDKSILTEGNGVFYVKA